MNILRCCQNENANYELKVAFGTKRTLKGFQK